jgi:hypothetical protein
MGMAEKINTLFKLSIIASLLLASSSVGYYYVLYLPRRDAQLDAERKLEIALQQERAEAEKLAAQQRAEDEKRAEQERALSQRLALEEQQSAEKAAAKTRYKECVLRVERIYQATWASNCKSIGDQANFEISRRKANCLTVATQAECDGLHPFRDTSPNCALPRGTSNDLTASLDKMRDRCLQESRAGLQ